MGSQYELTDNDREAIRSFASQGLSNQQITAETGIPQKNVASYRTYVEKKGLIAVGNSPQMAGIAGNSPQPGSSSIVSEVASAIKDGVQLGRETAPPPQGAADPADMIRAATQAIKTGAEMKGGNGNGQPQGELLQFLTTLVTQQESSSQAIITQLNTQHTNALDRMKEDHRLRMDELDKKFEREKERDKDYWGRIETAREKADEQRKELEKEERKLITDKLNGVDEQVTKNLEHANKLIEEREKSSDRYIELSEKLGGELADLRKEIGKGDGTQELLKHAIERLGEPIVKAIEKRGSNGALTLPGAVKQGAKREGAGVGLGKKVKEAIAQVVTKKLAPYIKEGREQMLKHLRKWPEVSMKFLVDLLWSWRMYADVSAYIQTAITFIVLNDIDELVEKAGDHLTDEARKALLSDKAKKWWAELQKEINKRVIDEERAQAAYDDYTDKGEKKGEQE